MDSMSTMPVASTSQAVAVVSVPALLPSPTCPPARRTDLVSLKLRLAELLTPEQGTAYWSGLADFFTGRINRNEWDDIMKRAFGRDRVKRQQALKLHNALVLSIVYNTTRPFAPPTSIRHSGFHPRGAKKRARDPNAGPPTELEEKRKRLVKDAVMALGRRERGEVKLLGAASSSASASTTGTAANTTTSTSAGKLKGQMLAADEERKRKRRAAEALSEAVDGTSRGGGGNVTAEGIPKALLAGGKDPASLAALASDYNRLLQSPLCCESRYLPDGDTLHDRMLAIGLEEGMASGIDGRAAGLLNGAMEHHLQNMIASVISLARGTRKAVPPPPRTASSSVVSTPMPSTFAPAGAAPSAPSPDAAPAAPAEDVGASLAKRDPNGLDHDADDSDLDERPPLSIADFHALFAISPALLGQHPNVAAVERMYAIAPQDSESDSEEYDSDEGDAAQQGSAAPVRKVTIDAAAKKEEPAAPSIAVAAGTPSSATGSTGVGAGKHPRLSRSRASSFYGVNRPVPVSSPAASVTAAAASGHPSGPSALGKGRFVIDPSSRHGVPEGHPSVPPLPSTPQALLPSWLGGSPASNGSGNAAAGTAAAAAPPGADLSPKSLALRNSLFPELASGSSAGAAAGASAAATGTDAHPDGNSTSTDAGDSDSEDESTKKVPTVPKAPPTTTSTGTGLKIKFGGGTVQGAANQQTGPSGQRLSASAQGAGAAPDRETGRKLWEVVDSVGLLDGVLPP